MPKYNYYKDIFAGKEMPFAFVDLNLMKENMDTVIENSGGKKIRIASKSVRSLPVIKKILEYNPVFQGIMCFTGPEAVWLSQQGMDDLLLGYPIWHPAQINAICAELKKGKRITLMVDSERHIHHLNTIGEAQDIIIPVCLDIDMSIDIPGLHFGVWRSPVNSVKTAMKVVSKIQQSPKIRLAGVMGYEAQVAGVGDNVRGQGLKNLAVRALKKRSVKAIIARRGAIVKAIEQEGIVLDFVNGGGTGSMTTTRTEDWVTEITVGSGFFSPALFDHYKDFMFKPAAGYAVEIVRKPLPSTYTCLGGGYVASGSCAPDKLPVIYLPEAAALTKNEAAGEVQTPVVYDGDLKLAIGDPIFMRHSKAGELCERFNSLHLVSDGKIIEEVPTYRGEGKCFL